VAKAVFIHLSVAGPDRTSDIVDGTEDMIKTGLTRTRHNRKPMMSVMPMSIQACPGFITVKIGNLLVWPAARNRRIRQAV
jgi:hypothetical protein